ncbi:MAG TPA: crosslink repair DNA glycosylase YcaQ family protein, partial [Gaiellaceae bacterium]
GALTEAAIREHWRLKGGKARLHHHLLALVDEGRLREVHVDDGGAPFYADAERELGGAPAPPVLVSPFDNIVWDRPLLERVFGFRHVIEIYKREHERVYGYYVLPLLAGDRFIGRADLKSDRAEGVLHVKRFTPEPRARGKLLDKLERAAERLARTIGLERAQLA